MKAFMLLAGLLSAVTSLSAQATPPGSDLFQKRCGGCHGLDQTKEGPPLRGVFGRSAGSASAFPYSKALREAKLNWDQDTLDRWIADPDQLVPGNDMSFHLNDAGERRQIVLFLKNIAK